MAHLPERLAGLLRPQAYPQAVEAVRVVETHISWVLLTGEFAYKIKRPVTFRFADLSSLERRRFFCAEEVRLNKRFAPELYVGVCAVTEEWAGRLRLDGPGPAVEYAVKMRQFDREQELDRLLAAGRVELEVLREFGIQLARIHDRLPPATAADVWGEPDQVAAALLENLDEIREVAAGPFGRMADEIGRAGGGGRAAGGEFVALLEQVAAVLSVRLDSSRSVFARRKAAGRVRECHGDLHSRNIVRIGERLVPFDCLEFAPAFRWIDVADEIAFLYADLLAEHRPGHAWGFLDGYLTASGDYEACRLLRLYGAHRLLVRGKVTALGAAGATGSDGAEDRNDEVSADADDARGRCVEVARATAYVEQALRILQPPPGLAASPPVQRGGSVPHGTAAGPADATAPLLILMAGLSGSGKTWLARRLAPELGAVHVRSDVERKRLVGLSETDRSDSSVGDGLYSADMTERTYARLCVCATDILAGGFDVIVDASFIRQRERRRFAELAARFNLRCVVVWCQAPSSVLRQRIEARAREGRDASEAGLQVLEWQERSAEPVSPDEGLAVLTADTAPDLRPRADAEVADLLREIRQLKRPAS